MSLPARSYLTNLIFFFLAQEALKSFSAWILINYVSQNWYNTLQNSGHQYAAGFNLKEVWRGFQKQLQNREYDFIRD